MADFINRETVVKLLRGELVSKYPMSFYMGLFAAADEISKISAADVAPVVHGRWKYYHKQNIAVCTNCSFERDLDANFGKAVSCPNCGAKMDGKEKHELFN